MVSLGLLGRETEQGHKPVSLCSHAVNPLTQQQRAFVSSRDGGGFGTIHTIH